MQTTADVKTRNQDLIIVIACCFGGRGGNLCRTTRLRLDKAIELTQTIKDASILVTGNVPYDINGTSEERKTIGELMRKYIVERTARPVITIDRAVDTFSEASWVSRFLERNQWYPDVYIVSSDFYLLSGRMIWRKKLAKIGIAPEFYPTYGTGTWRTWSTYIVISALFYAFSICGCFEKFGKLLVNRNQGRKQGFQWIDCK